MVVSVLAHIPNESRFKPSPARPPHEELSLTLTKEWAEQLMPAMERAVKYVWNEETADWKTRRVKIVMEEEPFREGGMRVAHKAWEVAGDQMVAGVIKYFKQREVSSNMCFNEAMTQMLADDYALHFNEALGSSRNVRFVPVTVLRLSERSGQIVSFEPFLGGKYVKHNDNDGHVDTKDELPQAFSHFSWEASNKKILVCDIQGVKDLYTDPQIHSIDGEGFGSGNMGAEGIQKFFKTHECNGICRSLGLPQVDSGKIHSPSMSSSSTVRMEEEDSLRSAKSSDSEGSSSGRGQRYVSAAAVSLAQEGSLRAKSSDSEGSSSGHGQRYVSAVAVSRALNGGRRERRGSACSVESDEGGGSSMGRSMFARALKSGGSKSKSRVGSMWSSGKAFGKALISAVKASVHSPTSSRSVSPVTNRGAGSPIGSPIRGVAAASVPEPSEPESLTPPKKFQGRKRSGRLGSASFDSPLDCSPLPGVAERD